MKWVPWDPSNIFLVTSFTWKRPESSDFMYSSIFMLENVWHLKLREGHMHSLQVPEAEKNENKKKAKCCCFYLFLLRRFGKKFNGYLSFLHCIKVSVFGVILVLIFPHSDQNNSEYGHFLRSAHLSHFKISRSQEFCTIEALKKN